MQKSQQQDEQLKVIQKILQLKPRKSKISLFKQKEYLDFIYGTSKQSELKKTLSSKKMNIATLKEKIQRLKIRKEHEKYKIDQSKTNNHEGNLKERVELKKKLFDQSKYCNYF